ncbi:MAG: AAA family ATPase [Actinomycetes bacterium]
MQGFRCLEDVDIPLDDVTTLIGPNGVGKSSILRALD